MLIASRSCQPRGAGRLARRQAAGIAQGTLIAAGSPPFPLRASILRWNRSDEAKMYSVRPDTWQPRIASNCAGAHRFERRPSRMAFRLVDPPGSSRRFCPPRDAVYGFWRAPDTDGCVREKIAAGEWRKLFGPGGAAPVALSRQSSKMGGRSFTRRAGRVSPSLNSTGRRKHPWHDEPFRAKPFLLRAQRRPALGTAHASRPSRCSRR